MCYRTSTIGCLIVLARSKTSLTRHLPAVTWHSEVSPEDVTLYALLTHTHGIKPGGPVDIRTAYTGDFTNDQLLRLLRLHPPSQTGRSFVYSSLGTDTPRGRKEKHRTNESD